MKTGKLKKRIKGSATIELLYIMPVVFLVLTVTFYIGFYFHDKGVLHGLVYEAAVIGVEDYRMDGEVHQEEIEEFLQEKGKDRLLFFSLTDMEIQENDTEVKVYAQCGAKNMLIQAEKSGMLGIPEKAIRKENMIQENIESAFERIWEVVNSGD